MVVQTSLREIGSRGGRGRRKQMLELRSLRRRTGVTLWGRGAEHAGGYWSCARRVTNFQSGREVLQDEGTGEQRCETGQCVQKE